jgi:hypothetical protein
MHRIPNIVVPPRLPANADSDEGEESGRRSAMQRYFRRIYDRILPLNMSRTLTRFILHLPTLYFLCRTLLLWALITLQTADLFPKTDNSTIRAFGKWSEELTMEQVNWMTFCAICAGFCVEGFVRSLDGMGFGFGAPMQANTSPFNLVSAPRSNCDSTN